MAGYPVSTTAYSPAMYNFPGAFAVTTCVTTPSTGPLTIPETKVYTFVQLSFHSGRAFLPKYNDSRVANAKIGAIAPISLLATAVPV